MSQTELFGVMRSTLKRRRGIISPRWHALFTLFSGKEPLLTVTAPGEHPAQPHSTFTWPSLRPAPERVRPRPHLHLTGLNISGPPYLCLPSPSVSSPHPPPLLPPPTPPPPSPVFTSLSQLQTRNRLVKFNLRVFTDLFYKNLIHPLRPPPLKFIAVLRSCQGFSVCLWQVWSAYRCHV